MRGWVRLSGGVDGWGGEWMSECGWVGWLRLSSG